MAVQDHVEVVSSLVAVVLVVQRLVHVADEVNDKLQGFGLGCPVCVGVSQDGEKLLSLADHTLQVSTEIEQRTLLPWQLAEQGRKHRPDQSGLPDAVFAHQRNKPGT